MFLNMNPVCGVVDLTGGLLRALLEISAEARPAEAHHFSEIIWQRVFVEIKIQVLRALRTLVSDRTFAGGGHRRRSHGPLRKSNLAKTAGSHALLSRTATVNDPHQARFSDRLVEWLALSTGNAICRPAAG
jgi:hypothetical protein